MGSKTRLAIAAVAVALLLAALAAASFLWNGLGPDRISAAGWVAMILGALLALALGIGLVSLMVFSHRQGYDEGPGE
jgi:hypothetical protein